MTALDPRLPVPEPGDHAQADSRCVLDGKALNLFTDDMRVALAHARATGKHGWEDPSDCPDKFLAELLLEQLIEPDRSSFLDIACLAMFLHLRGANPGTLYQVLRNWAEAEYDHDRPDRP